MADTVFGVQYNGGVILATDQNNARSILVYQSNLDKIASLTSHSAMAVAGPNCDLVNFTEYVSKNIQLYELSNDGTKLSIHAQANFARGELAKAIRKGPYQVNVLIGGYDTKKTEKKSTTKKTKEDGGNGSVLYYLDYMGTLQKVKYGSQGYAAYFTLSIMDREYPATTEQCTEADAIKIVENCIAELQKRFMLAQTAFVIKAIDKDGIRVVRADNDPADT